MFVSSMARQLCAVNFSVIVEARMSSDRETILVIQDIDKLMEKDRKKNLDRYEMKSLMENISWLRERGYNGEKIFC